MADFTAGHISQPEADDLIDALNQTFGDQGLCFHAGVSYRNLMVGPLPQAASLICTPPHDIPDEPVADSLPRGPEAGRIRELMAAAREILAGHPVNLERARRGQSPATDIWLWGQGRLFPVEPFAGRFGLRGAAVAAVDLIRGIARVAGLDVLDVPGATGYLDTDYAAKGRAACAALAGHDLVFVHVEAPDEAGHQGDAAAKITAIEQIDRHIVAPLLETLKRYGDWRMLIAPDHPTPVAKRVHTSTPPPFCMAGSGIGRREFAEPAAGLAASFCEAAAASTGIRVNPGYELLRRFLRSPF